ncbi:MAG: 50S ribosomal protein L13 [Puniceicoccales bacterium]|jgi:large subunit ribosomal protein L13|nr:50S ribosomal protein L13 [Puniceicoccales bacterium]
MSTSTLAKKEQHGAATKKWYLFDASEEILGRMAVRVANILRGRHRPTYTPHVDSGDFVVVVNADRVRLSGKKDSRKKYMFYTGYMGNEKYRTPAQMRVRDPRFVVEHAVRGMMPKNRLADAAIKKLKVYGGPDHPHAAQNPEKL